MVGGGDTTDGGGGKGGKKKGKGQVPVMTRADLQVEYAKSGRSNCRHCNSAIGKGDIRVAKMEQPDLTQTNYSGLVPHWHHVECFLERAEELGAGGVSAAELSGFSLLEKVDQTELKTKLGGGDSGKKKTTAAGR